MKYARSISSYLIKIIIIITIFSLTQGCGSGAGSQKISLQTEYQAVFLGNGQVFFGKAETGPDYVTLKDVFYIQSQVNPENKQQVRNILIKRGQELHGPDLMYISKAHVVLIEPVSSESQVAKLIKEAKAQKPAETK
jgi:hypothetical protein